MTSSGNYKVWTIHVQAPDQYEQMGSKEKFWFRLGDDERSWLFKFGREGTGEAWAEKIAAEIAEVLGICHAQVELATHKGKMGTISRSFVDRDNGFDLVHGSEVLAGSLLGYDKKKAFHQSQHTLDNIIKAVSNTLSSGVFDMQMSKLAGYFFFDALIGNTDRHHDNWGLLSCPRPGEGNEYTVAPSFDHASSMGRELSDERRRNFIGEGRIRQYVMKGRGGVYWKEDDRFGLNPVDLVRRAVADSRYRQHFIPWLEKAALLNADLLGGSIERVPDEWMSPAAKNFCQEFLKASLGLLLEGD